MNDPNCVATKRHRTYGTLKCWATTDRHPLNEQGRPYHWAKIRNYDGHDGVMYFQWL